jgi:antitoxin (DNA-binding transcriptional repressor) of toxin-antitoxin stability system
MTRTISRAELRNGSAGIMDALEAGEDFVITRNGAPVGELRPIRRRIDLSSE